MLLIAKNLSKRYIIEKGLFSSKTSIIDALSEINFQLKEGSVLGILGETGSGKTTLAKLVVNLINPTKGEIIYNFEGINRSIQMVFQNPFSSLNPVMKIKNILSEPFLIHGIVNRQNVKDKITELLEKVELDYGCLNRYPDEFSGGQRQRIAIARAISINPKILVCDEPTASLDLSVQSKILNLFVKLKKELLLSYIFISHNIEVISFIADEVLILYEGNLVEKGLKHKILNNPQHPYTKILLGREEFEPKKINLVGNNSCKFYPNCKTKTKLCLQSSPKEIRIEEGHHVSCHNFK